MAPWHCQRHCGDELCMVYKRNKNLTTFSFDFCCFRAVTARPITTFFKSALQFFILIFAVFEPLYCNEISSL
jgi:hypothetical protein